MSHHSGVWKFLDFLKKDQHDNTIMMTQLAAGHTRIRHPVKGTIKRNQQIIETIVSNYESYKDEGNVVTYLKAIGNKLKLNAVVPEQEVEE